MQNPQKLLVEIGSLKERNKFSEQENNFLREQFSLAQSRQFGTTSKKSPSLRQPKRKPAVNHYRRIYRVKRA
jgi:hypothetical protein